MVHVQSAPRATAGRSPLRSACAADLRASRLLRDLDDDKLAWVANQGETRRFENGQVSAIGDKGGMAVYFVLSGLFRLSLMTPAARYVSIRTAEPGSHFGEIAIFAGGGRRDYYVHCDRAGECFVLGERAFRTLMNEAEEIHDAVMRHIALDAVVRGERIYEFATLDLRYRMLAELLRLARPEAEAQGPVTIEPAPTHEALAAQVGGSREAVTRLMQEFSRQGLLRVPRRGVIEVPDYAILSAMVARKTGMRSASAP